MERFLTYAESVRPGFTETLEGSLGFEIAEYEQVTRCKLPREYRSFLEVMGESDGGLQLFDEHAKTGASLLADYYRENVLTGQCRFPPGTIPVAVRGWYIEEACLSTTGAEEGKVWINLDTKLAFRYADTLSSLACTRAFVALEMNLLPLSGMYLSQDFTPRMEAIREALTEHQFQLTEFSDSVGVAARRGEVSVFARQHTGDVCWVRIAAKARKEITATAKQICKPYGLHLDRWYTPR